MVWDSVRPVVLLPVEALEWTAERLRVVLLHEFAHVRRGDLWTHAMARLATLLYWWNPLAWIAWREFLRERERATDDLVLRMGTGASDYAGHLLEIARTMRVDAPVAVAMIRRSELEERMMAILDTKTNRRNAGAAVVAGVLMVALAVGVPLAAMQAQSGGGSAPAGVVNDSDLIRMGHRLRAERKPNEARASYQKALENAGSKAEGIEALIALGVMAFHDKDLATAEGYFSKAQLLDPLQAGKATMWMAMVRERQERFTEAESLLQAALATQKAESLASVVTMELYGYLLKNLDREDEGKSMMQRAEAIRKRVEPAVYLKAERGTAALRIGGEVQAPKLLSKVEPQYTDEARAARHQGTVVVKVEILPDGTARNVQVVRGLPYGLNENAVEAIGQWRFQPGTKGGQPVTVAATVEVNYRLL
jgi:TonB family protein